jgi:3-hydroxyisobutyrate dehydrogenase
MSRIAFIGLGNMGAPMAANLLKAGHALRVFDLTPAAVDAAVVAGGVAATSAIDAVVDADIVISMLPASRHVEGLYLDASSGLLPHIPAHALVIDCSTIAPASAQKVAEGRRETRPRDARCSRLGRHRGRRGRHADLHRRRRGDVLWSARGPSCRHGQEHLPHGRRGAGQVAKLCNNMALGVIMAVTGEALALGRRMAWMPRCCRR